MKRGVKCFVKKSDLSAYLRKRDCLDIGKFAVDADRKLIVLSENYGIAVPLCPENQMPMEHVVLLSFYSRIFRSREDTAVDIILKFLKNPDKIKGELGLAKLWVVKDYCVNKSLRQKNESLLSKFFGHRKITQILYTHPPRGSMIFVNGSPFLDSAGMLDLQRSLADEPGKESDAYYPATF